jgi:hypothetical protein
MTRLMRISRRAALSMLAALALLTLPACSGDIKTQLVGKWRPVETDPPREGDGRVVNVEFTPEGQISLILPAGVAKSNVQFLDAATIKYNDLHGTIKAKVAVDGDVLIMTFPDARGEVAFLRVK